MAFNRACRALAVCAALFLHSTVTNAAQWQVQVTDDIPTLQEISLYLYGTTQRYGQIAEWNGLAAPYAVRIGQTLQLREAPVLTPEQGRQKVLEMWRSRFALAPEPEPMTLEEKLRIEFEDSLRRARVKEQGSDGKVIKSAEEWFSDGERLYEEKELEKSLASFREVLRIEARHLPARVYEVRLLLLLQRNGEARTQAQKLIADQPQFAHVPFFRTVLNSSQN